MCNCQRTRAEMFREQAPQVTTGHPQPRGKFLDVAVVEGAVRDQAKAARDGRRCAAPRGRAGRTLGATAKARPVTGLARGGGGREERDVLALRRVRGTDRAAVDSGRPDPDEEVTVEAPVAREPCPFVDLIG